MVKLKKRNNYFNATQLIENKISNENLWLLIVLSALQSAILDILALLKSKVQRRGIKFVLEDE